MTSLVASLSTGKGTWSSVLKLMASPQFESVYLVVNEWTKNNLQTTRQGLNFVIINSSESTAKIRDDIARQLHGQIKDFEVALNIESGTGKEHAAIITALMQLGLSFRFVEIQADKIEEVSFSLKADEGL